MVRVHRVETRKDQPLDLRFLNPETYAHTMEEMADKWNILLPDLTTLELQHNPDSRLLLNPIDIKIYTNKGLFKYGFRPGYITDLASVPKRLRSIVDNDQQELLYAALVHDANFMAHLQTMEFSNKLFYGMIRKAGGSIILAGLCYIAVSSPAARRFYRNKEGWEITMLRDTLDYSFISI